tara:strand:- start:13 stop:1260 length:1248 start_codon:yes stop_codon:yes gene_type:complete
MKKLFFTFLLLFFQLNSVCSQTIKSDQIGLISFQKFNDNTSSNLFIGTINESFNLTFDILSGIEYDLYYVIEHCDFNWKKSQLIKSEYLQGFDDVKIDDYYSSFNTYQTYTHYKLSFPNRNTKIKKSGNYIIKVLDEYGYEIFRRKFILFENLASVQAEIKRSRELEYVHSKQVVNFEINPINIQFNNPKKTVKVKVFKNNDMNNAIENIRPQYNIGKKLIYKYDSELSFWGGNEYLYFENKFIRNTNIRIRSFDLNDIYSSFLYTDFPRKNKKYTYNPDINGSFLVDVSNSSNPEYEADYVNVHFYLELEEVKDINSKIYLQGDFNNYEISEKYVMEFNPDTNLHEISIKLKQGFYNYKYVSVDSNNNIIYGSVGGNFDETENEYNVVVYYRNFGERYDRVVGAGKGLSKYITN